MEDIRMKKENGITLIALVVTIMVEYKRLFSIKNKRIVEINNFNNIGNIDTLLLYNIFNRNKYY